MLLLFTLQAVEPSRMLATAILDVDRFMLAYEMRSVTEVAGTARNLDLRDRCDRSVVQRLVKVSDVLVYVRQVSLFWLHIDELSVGDEQRAEAVQIRHPP